MKPGQKKQNELVHRVCQGFIGAKATCDFVSQLGLELMLLRGICLIPESVTDFEVFLQVRQSPVGLDVG